MPPLVKLLNAFRKLPTNPFPSDMQRHNTSWQFASGNPANYFDFLRQYCLYLLNVLKDIRTVVTDCAPRPTIYANDRASLCLFSGMKMVNVVPQAPFKLKLTPMIIGHEFIFVANDFGSATIRMSQVLVKPSVSCRPLVASHGTIPCELYYTR